MCMLFFPFDSLVNNLLIDAGKNSLMFYNIIFLDKWHMDNMTYKK